jgi:CheY-like chemotaxis protein
MLKTVMLVDDDDVTLMICKLRLEKAKFCKEVIRFENGSDAIQFFEKQLLLPTEQRTEPELIFLDINMPVMNGWEFIQSFEAHYLSIFPNTKIIILSSSVDPKDEEMAMANQRILGFLTKPLSDQNLQELMHNTYFINKFNHS